MRTGDLESVGPTVMLTEGPTIIEIQKQRVRVFCAVGMFSPFAPEAVEQFERPAEYGQRRFDIPIEHLQGREARQWAHEAFGVLVALTEVLTGRSDASLDDLVTPGGRQTWEPGNPSIDKLRRDVQHCGTSEYMAELGPDNVQGFIVPTHPDMNETFVGNVRNVPSWGANIVRGHEGRWRVLGMEFREPTAS